MILFVRTIHFGTEGLSEFKQGLRCYIDRTYTRYSMQLSFPGLPGMMIWEDIGVNLVVSDPVLVLA